jgi:hypothetical protein
VAPSGRTHTDHVKPFFRVALGFLVADYVAGGVAWVVALSLVSSESCNVDPACIIDGTFNLFLALAVFVIVALGSAGVLSVAASQLAPPGRRVLAGAIHLPLLVAALLLTAYLANDPITVVLVVPLVAALATAAITTGRPTAMSSGRERSGIEPGGEGRTGR